MQEWEDTFAIFVFGVGVTVILCEIVRFIEK